MYNPLSDVAISSDELDIFQKILEKKRFQFFIKRILDIIISIVLIIIFSPLMLLISILIKITSRGPIVFSQYRVGLNGHHFKCYKFRSMTNDPLYNSRTNTITNRPTSFFYKQKYDSRVTAVGKIIRKTSIDELPQFFNVLKGNMSIVGPRPLVPSMLEPYPKFYQLRCMIKPGISGLWQIRDREKNTNAAYMFAHDTEYVANFNIILDLKIIFITPLIVISGKGAY